MDRAFNGDATLEGLGEKASTFLRKKPNARSGRSILVHLLLVTIIIFLLAVDLTGGVRAGVEAVS
jgi:hypothetical protein